MNYPRNLVPSTAEHFKLDDGRVVEVPKATPSFATWTAPPPGDTYGGKAILDFNGRPAFAELVILWSFIEAAWDGVWMDYFGSRRLRGFWPTPLPGELPAEQSDLLERIVDHAPRKATPWDVFCWSPDGVLFAEATRHGRDSIRPGQTAFLGAGSRSRVACFLLPLGRMASRLVAGASQTATLCSVRSSGKLGGFRNRGTA